MRDSNLSTSRFCDSVNTQSEVYLFQFSEILPRITPSALGADFENLYRITDTSIENLTCLSILYHYLPDEIRFLLKLAIEENINSDTWFLRLLLDTKGQMMCFLIDTKLWHTRDFFGNIFNTKSIKHALLSIKPVRKTKRKPKRVQRHRGYRDKGTLRLESDKHDLWYSSVRQNQIEQDRITLNDCYRLLQGFIT